MRSLAPELLDLLPAEDARAQRSRNDLVRINAVMRHAAVMARALSDFPEPAIFADLGGGDGRFMLSVAKRLAPRWRRVRLVIADRQDIVSASTRAAFAQLGWHCESVTGDVCRAMPDADIVAANLFLHHFDDAALGHLLAAIARRARGFVACEPRRSRLALAASGMVGALGAGSVTRHDAVASVAAGFKGREISELWPEGSWALEERTVWPFSHLFAARAL
jgi:hypothetical protein